MTSIARDTAGRLADRIKQTVADRGQTYGTPEANFANIAGLWNVYLRARYGMFPFLDAADVGQMSALIKIARLAESPTHEDSALDAAAYVMLGHGCAVESAQRKTAQVNYSAGIAGTGKLATLVDPDNQIGPVGSTASAGGEPVPAAPIETVNYPDGTSATGVAPLPAASPAETPSAADAEAVQEDEKLAGLSEGQIATLNNGGAAVPLAPAAEDNQEGAPFNPLDTAG